MAEISLIVPVYRAEAYLPACVDSILNQTFSDFELILVNDGSPDGCPALCDAYARRDGRVRVLHQKNQGQAAARNNALPLCGGSWIGYVDSDDLLHPQMLEVLYRCARESGAAIAACPGWESPEPEEGFYAPARGQYQLLTMDEETLLGLLQREEYPGWVVWGKLIRKEILEKHPFCPGRVYEDNAIVCRWLLEAMTVASIPEKLYFYRVNPEGTTKSAFSVKRLDYLWALEEIIGFYTQKGYFCLRDRFWDVYVRTAADYYPVTLHTLARKDLAKNMEKKLFELKKRHGLSLSKEQFEQLLCAMHPGAARLYWPAEGVVRTLATTGVRGIMQKLGKNRERGEGQ